MRIAVDGLPLTQPMTGIGRYTRELLRQFFHLRPENQYRVSGLGRSSAGEVLAPAAADAWFATGGADAPPLPPTLGPLLRGAMRIRNTLAGDVLSSVRRRLVGRALGRAGVDAFLGTNFLGMFHRSYATVITIHDLAHHYYPEAANPYMLRMLKWELPTHAARARHIIAVSEHTRRDVISLLNVPPDKVTVAAEGVSPQFHPTGNPAEPQRLRGKYSLPDRFVLFVGTVEPRKNLETLARAFDQLEADASFRHGLVIAGGKGWKDERIQRALAGVREPGRVRCLGFVPEEDLPGLYRLADALAFPSWYEGFGLPALEAMACGTPVIASSVSALPEVVGEAGLLCDPGSVAEWAAAIRRLVDDAELRQRLSAAGLERAAGFTWERTAKVVLAVLERAAGERAASAACPPVPASVSGP